MNRKKFIIEKLTTLSETNKDIKIRYEYLSGESLHIIEVLPLNIFEDNIDYVIQEVKIQDEFEALFGYTEEILFVSDSSLNSVKNPEFIIGY